MNHYLVIYNRREGQVIRRHDYSRPEIALRARFAAEREFSGQPDISYCLTIEFRLKRVY